MLTLKVDSNIAKLARDLDMEQKAYRTAASRALNNAARGRRTDLSKELRSRYRMKKADVDKKIAVSFASVNSLRAEVNVRDRPLSVGRFMVGQDKRPNGGVIVNIKGARKIIRHTFVQKVKGGADGEYTVVFERVGAGRYPLRAVRTINVANAAEIKELRALVDSLTNNRFDKEFSRQLDLMQKQISAATLQFGVRPAGIPGIDY